MNQRGFVIPSFFLSPTGMMATAIAVLTLTNFLTYKLWRSEVAEYAQFRTDVETQSALLKAEMDRVKAESARVDAEAGAGWKAAADYWRINGGTIRVQPNCDSGGVRPVPASANQPRSAAEELRPDPIQTITVEQCETRINNAVLDAAQVEHIRAWIRDQRKASVVK